LVCITINLYSFVLYILNNFLKNKLRKKLLPRVLPTDEFGRYFKHSPTDLPTELIRQHLTVAVTSTDKFTDGYIRSVFHPLTDGFTDGWFPSVNHNITDGIKICQYISNRNIFFWRANFICKTIGKWFFCFSDRYSDGRGNHRRRES